MWLLWWFNLTLIYSVCVNPGHLSPRMRGGGLSPPKRKLIGKRDFLLQTTTPSTAARTWSRTRPAGRWKCPSGEWSRFSVRRRRWVAGAGSEWTEGSSLSGPVRGWSCPTYSTRMPGSTAVSPAREQSSTGGGAKLTSTSRWRVSVLNLFLNSGLPNSDNYIFNHLLKPLYTNCSNPSKMS